MNYITEIKNAYKALKQGYGRPLLTQEIQSQLQGKAVSDTGLNVFQQALYWTLGINQPVYMADNYNAYITKGYLNADVFSIVNYRANLQQNITWKLYRKTGAESWDVIQDHELLELVNTLDLYALSVYEDVVGNAYLYAPWLEFGANKGKTKELNILKADLVQIVSGGANMPVKAYKYITDSRNAVGIPAEQVLHFKRFNPSSDPQDSLFGLSPLKAAAQNVALSNFATHSMTASYANQGVKALVFSKDNAEVNWSREQAMDLQDTWRRKNGVNQTGDVVFHSKELGKIDLGLSPVELGTLAGKVQNFRDLCNVYDGFPSPLLNDNERSTYNNLDSADKRVYTNCAIPKRARWRDGLNKWLVPRWGDDLWLDYDTSNVEVLQENKKETAEYLEKCPWIKLMDKQKIMGFPEDKNLDFYLFPPGQVPVQNINDLMPTTQANDLKRLREKGGSEYGL